MESIDGCAMEFTYHVLVLMQYLCLQQVVSWTATPGHLQHNPSWCLSVTAGPFHPVSPDDLACPNGD